MVWQIFLCQEATLAPLTSSFGRVLPETSFTPNFMDKQLSGLSINRHGSNWPSSLSVTRFAFYTCVWQIFLCIMHFSICHLKKLIHGSMFCQVKSLEQEISETLIRKSEGRESTPPVLRLSCQIKKWPSSLLKLTKPEHCVLHYPNQNSVTHSHGEA